MRPEGAGTLLVLPLLVAGALAGCTSPPHADPLPGEQEPEPLEQTGLAPTNATANQTQPDDQSAFAKSLDEKFHVHDYWGGALERTLLDADVESGELVPSPLGPQSDTVGYLFAFVFSQGVGTALFLLPEGSIVPPETERLEVTITWASSPTITGLYLTYNTAADSNEDFRSLEPLPDGGGTYTIPTNLSDNDIPHTVESKWRFYLVPDNDAAPNAPGLFNGTAHVTIKAFRPDVLFVAPPHPDFWGANTTLALFNHSAAMKGSRAVVPLFVPGDTGGFDLFAPPEGSIIVPHTALLTLTLTWENNSTLPDAFGTSLELYYNAPDSWDFLPPDAASSEPGKVVYTIPVDARKWDSPYANQSQWQFFIAMDSDAATDQGAFAGDVGFFDGSYTVAAVAEREQAG